VIPRLVLDESTDGAARLDAALDAGVEIWHDAQGAIVAYSATVDGQHRMDMPGLARFRFEAGGTEVIAHPHGSASPELVREAYHRGVLPLALQLHGTEVLHASAVRMPRGVVALCADSGTGKSTLAVGLSRRGYPVWADDAIAVDTSGPSVMTIPLPFEIRLRPAALSFLRYEHAPVDTPANPEPLRALCVLKRADRVDGSVAVEPLRPPVALPALLAHGYCFSLQDPERKRRMMRHYLDLVARVPVFEVRFEPDLERLPEILDGIEQALTWTE